MSAWLKRVQRLAARDGWVCWLCLGSLSKRAASLDHVVPRAQGGSSRLDNLKLAHKRCNNRRGSRPGVAGMFSAVPLAELALDWRPRALTPFDEALAQQKQDEDRR